MIKDLILVANSLDEKGMTKEADSIDSIIKKMSQLDFGNTDISNRKSIRPTSINPNEKRIEKIDNNSDNVQDKAKEHLALADQALQINNSDINRLSVMSKYNIANKHYENINGDEMCIVTLNGKSGPITLKVPISEFPTFCRK